MSELFGLTVAAKAPVADETPVKVYFALPTQDRSQKVVTREIGDIVDTRWPQGWAFDLLRSHRAKLVIQQRGDNPVAAVEALGILWPIYANASGFFFCAPKRMYEFMPEVTDRWGQNLAPYYVAAASAIFRELLGQPPLRTQKVQGQCMASVPNRRCLALRWLRTGDAVLGDAVAQVPSYGSGHWRTYGMHAPRYVCAWTGAVVDDEARAVATANRRLVRGEQRTSRVLRHDLGAGCPLYASYESFPTLKAERRGDRIVCRVPGTTLVLRVA